MLLAWLSAGFQSLPLLPTSKLVPSGADSQLGGFVYTLGPCGFLQWTHLWGWEFLPPPQPSRVFWVRGLRLYFPMLGCGICLALQLFFPVYPHANVGTATLPAAALPALVLQPLPCRESSLPCCPSSPLLQVWMNVSSLTPWLLDFHTVQFSGSSGYFFVFKFVVVLLLVVLGGTVCLPTPPSWLEAPNFKNKSKTYSNPHFPSSSHPYPSWKHCLCWLSPFFQILLSLEPTPAWLLSSLQCWKHSLRVINDMHATKPMLFFFCFFFKNFPLVPAGVLRQFTAPLLLKHSFAFGDLTFFGFFSSSSLLPLALNSWSFWKFYLRSVSYSLFP